MARTVNITYDTINMIRVSIVSQRYQDDEEKTGFERPVVQVTVEYSGEDTEPKQITKNFEIAGQDNDNLTPKQLYDLINSNQAGAILASHLKAVAQEAVNEDVSA